jgi:orotate phosphoribosyltransferase
MNHHTLAQRIYAVAHRTGTFTLRSGAISNEYFDKYQFESDPVLLRAIAEELAPRIPPDTEMLAGLEMGGIAIAVALSQVTGIPAVFVRKKAKPYGTAQLCEGPSVEGRKVCVVEDVVTSGGQVVISTADLRALGAIITHVVCVIDREQGGSQALADAGLLLLPLFTMSELKGASAA